MSAEPINVKTDEDSGQRQYNIPGLGWTNSLTTVLKMYPAFLHRAAGIMGMERTRDHAVALVKEYATPVSDPAQQPTFEDFDYWLDVRLKADFGTYKNGNVRPPHEKYWGIAADEGTALHAGVESWASPYLGTTVPKMVESAAYLRLPPASQKRVIMAAMNFYAWAQENKAVPLASEEILWLPGETAGVHSKVACRIDLALATMAGGRTILDAKAGKLDRGKPYMNHMIQVEIQRRCWNFIHPDQQADEAGILHTPADGGPVKVFTVSEMKLDPEHLVRTFNACAELFNCVHGEPTGEK